MSRTSPPTFNTFNGAQQHVHPRSNDVSPLPPIQPPCIKRNSSNSPRPPPAMNKNQLRILTRHSSSSPHSGVSSNRMPSPVSSLVDDHTDTDDEDEELEDVPIGNISANIGKRSGKTSPPDLIPSSSKESTTSSSNNASGRSTPILSQAALSQLDQRNTISNQYANIHHYNQPLQNPNYLQQQSNNNNMHPQPQPFSRPLSPNANTTAIQSTSQNNAKSITPLHQIPYVHGGYAAAAPLFITDSKFASILKKLLPSAYYELSILLKNSNSIPKSVKVARMEGSRDAAAAKVGTINEQQQGNNNKQGGVPKARLKRISSVERLKQLSSCTVDTSTNTATTTTVYGDGKSEVILSDPVKIMKWAENNPVVSAFGIWNSDSGRRTIKFMQGIQLLQQPIPLNNNHEEDLDDRQSFISGGGYTESVVTIGSNGNNFGYRNSMMGYQPQRHTTAHHNTTTANPLHGMASKRRKQPEPDPIPETASGIEVTTLGVSGLSTTTIPPKPRYNKPALEWDVFLDPSLVKQVDNAMSIVDKLEVKLRKIRIKRERKKAVATAMKQQQKTQQYNRASSRGSGVGMNHSENTRGTHIDNKIDDIDDDEDENDDDFDILQSHTAAQVEVDRLVSQLMRRTIIAHGSMSQLVLEAMGVAPKYNFGRVVKSSRENLPSHSPSRSSKRVSLRVGNTEAEISINMNTTSEWDDDEEQRDFEALLDPSILNNTTGSDTKNGKQQPQKQSGTARRPTSSSSGGSKGMFMETWIHVFSQTLSLLVKSSKSDTTSSGDDGIATKSSSTSSKSNTSSHGNRQHQQHLLVKNRPAKIGERGISGLLERMFLRRDSSINEVTAGREQSDDVIEDQDGNDQALDCYGEDDDDASDLLTNNDMFSPATPTSSSFGMGMCGMSLCLGMNDSDNKTSGGRGASSSTFPINPHASHKMTHDIERISTVLGEPLRLVLDLKSRRVPPRVWSRLIDSLRTRGLIIEGIGSFDMDELRVIGKGCSYPLTPLLFFHSVGDLQRACHANEVKNGDTVYFNGGSLMWKRSSIMEAAERGCCGTVDTGQENDITATGDGSARSPRSGGNYSFQPYAFPRSALSDWERAKVKATIEDYRRHFNLKIGVYVQEFSISAEALDALSVFVNKHGDLYDQGLAFGGINGAAVKNISGDGYWNQRYMGRPWDFDARPSSEMTPLAPEDHHLVQKAIQAGAWGQVMDAYEVRDEQAGALTVLQPPRELLQEPCHIINDY